MTKKKILIENLKVSNKLLCLDIEYYAKIYDKYIQFLDAEQCFILLVK